MRPQRQKENNCPFCNHPKLTVRVAKDMRQTEVAKREREEQGVIEAQIRAADNLHAGNAAPPGGGADGPGAPAAAPAFGSSLQSHPSPAAAPSLSFGSDGGGSAADTMRALSAEDRRAREEIMRDQTSHRSWIRLRNEEEQRRQVNELEYYRTRRRRGSEGAPEPGAEVGVGDSAVTARRSSLFSPSDALSSDFLRLAGGLGSGGSGAPRLAARGVSRDWDRIVASLPARGDENDENWRGGNLPGSLDDMVVLEAAIMLSMQEERERQRMAETENRHQGGSNGETEVEACVGSEAQSEIETGTDGETHHGENEGGRTPIRTVEDSIDDQAVASSVSDIERQVDEATATASSGDGTREDVADDHAAVGVVPSAVEVLSDRRELSFCIPRQISDYAAEARLRATSDSPERARRLSQPHGPHASEVDDGTRNVSEEEMISMAIAMPGRRL